MKRAHRLFLFLPVAVLSLYGKGDVPPSDANRPDPKLLKQLLDAISKTLTAENLSRQSKFGRTVFRRLTRAELQHTLNDLLSIDIDLSEVLPPENSSSEFDTIAEKQGLSEIHMRAYLAAADAAIEQFRQSMVMFGSNLGNANSHDAKNLPIVVAGGDYEHGQHIAYDPQANTPLSNLFVSMMQKVNLPVERFGSSDGSITW